MVGKKIGRLTVLEFAGYRFTGGCNRSQWLCKCECGKTTIRLQQSLVKSAVVVSCGCYLREFQRSGNAHRSHCHAVNKKPSATYRSWQSMKARCSNPKNIGYANYGGRGISVCDRWSQFENFLSDLGECPPGHTIERKDVNGDYTPDNCTWIPRSEQSGNRRGIYLVTHEGKEWTVPELALKFGISVRGLRRRIERGVVENYRKL